MAMVVLDFDHIGEYSLYASATCSYSLPLFSLRLELFGYSLYLRCLKPISEQNSVPPYLTVLDLRC